MMIPSLVAIALATPVLAAEPALSPVEARLGLYGVAPFADLPVVGWNAAWYVGVDAEAGPRGGFWSVGGASWSSFGLVSPATSPWASVSATTLFGRLKWQPDAAQTWSVLAGYNQYDENENCSMPCMATIPDGTFFAVSWAYEHERFWLRLTPQYTIPLDRAPSTDRLFHSAIPWIDAGFRLTPNFGFGLRLSTAPLRAEWRF